LYGRQGFRLIAGALTSLRVECGTSPQGPFATVAGLSHVGSAQVLVNLAGGTAVTYNATATESTASTNGIHTVTVSCTDTCGT
jgi:hypothetical protein